MGRSLNHGRNYGPSYARWVVLGARRHPNVNGYRGVDPEEARAVRVKLARLKREADERRRTNA
jgi:hypothetical protein